MIKTILIIIISVTIFGIVFFVLVRNALRKKLDILLEEEKTTTEDEGVEADGVTFDPKDIGEIEDGYHKTYNENKDIYMDGEFKNGKLWTGKHYIYDENGLLERIEVYKDGKYVGNGVL